MQGIQIGQNSLEKAQSCTHTLQFHTYYEAVLIKTV